MDNGAKEAALFYCSVFLGTVENPSEIISENQLVVSFQLLGNKFFALNGGPVFQKNPSISFFVVTEAFLQMTKFDIEKLLKA
jgi:predicted 3-demethylubiquinone-9 3-methyltransferase (glyoxalase superfamily)